MKKRVLLLFSILSIVCALTVCGCKPAPAANEVSSADAQNNATSTESMPTESDDDSASESSTLESDVAASNSKETSAKSLVVYFSWGGNTRNVAKSIQKQTNSDLFELAPATPYSKNYNTVLDEAKKEQRDDARPKIKDTIKNIADYDVVYVGFPNWWGDMPMILYSFFDLYDLSGKTVAMFCTSGGSGLSGCVGKVKKLEPKAVVTTGLHIGSDDADNPDEDVKKWLQKINVGK